MNAMADHYYTKTPESPHRPLRFQAEYRGQPLTFQTDSGVFSRTEIDKGTRILLTALPEPVSGDVLDMGCGYGALGICLKKHSPGCRLTMADVNTRAVALAAQNAAINGVDAETLQSDGFAALENRRFDLIATNPPIRAGKQVIYKMFADAATALRERGAFWLVIRKQQGAPSAVATLNMLFGTVVVLEKKGGYWVIRCENNLQPAHNAQVAVSATG
jgi:16S rRNA (guanine1207-N2)-methyltransferase